MCKYNCVQEFNRGTVRNDVNTNVFRSLIEELSGTALLGKVADILAVKQEVTFNNIRNSSLD